MNTHEAIVFLSQLIDRKVEAREFYRFTQDGTIRAANRSEGERDRLQFSEEAIREGAERLKAAQERISGLLTTKEVQKYLQDLGLHLKMSTIYALIAKGNLKTAETIEHAGRPQFLFRREDVEALMGEFQDVADLKKRGYLTTPEAVEFLKKRLKREVKPDTLYHLVDREILPVVKVKIEENRRASYFFHPDDLKKVSIGRPRGKSAATPIYEKTKPVKVKSIEALHAQEEKLGVKLITEDEVLRIWHSRTGQEYTKHALRMRRQRGSFSALAQLGSTLFYSEQAAREVSLQPKRNKFTFK